MEQLRHAYEAQTGTSLIHDIERHTSGHFEYGLRGLVLGPSGFDVWLLHYATHHHMGADEELLIELLVDRKNEDIEALLAEYHRHYHKDLKHIIRNELHFKQKAIFNMILAVRFYQMCLI